MLSNSVPDLSFMNIYGQLAQVPGAIIIIDDKFEFNSVTLQGEIVLSSLCKNWPRAKLLELQHHRNAPSWSYSHHDALFWRSKYGPNLVDLLLAPLMQALGTELNEEKYGILYCVEQEITAFLKVKHTPK
ncbi:hypothetical protein P3S68_005211 [Capsicum galapagoense]